MALNYIFTTPYPWPHLLKSQTLSSRKRKTRRPEMHFFEYLLKRTTHTWSPHWSLKASSVAYFLTYSATFFLYSSGLKIKDVRIIYISLMVSQMILPMKIHCSSITIERICGVGVSQKLRQERLKDIREIVQGGPGLVDDIQTNSSRNLVNIWVINLNYQSF